MNEIPEWSEVEALPEFATLTPAQKLESYDQWERDYVGARENDDLKPEDLFNFELTSALTRKQLGGEDVNEDTFLGLKRDLGKKYTFDPTVEQAPQELYDDTLFNASLATLPDARERAFAKATRPLRRRAYENLLMADLAAESGDLSAVTGSSLQNPFLDTDWGSYKLVDNGTSVRAVVGDDVNSASRSRDVTEWARKAQAAGADPNKIFENFKTRTVWGDVKDQGNLFRVDSEGDLIVNPAAGVALYDKDRVNSELARIGKSGDEGALHAVKAAREGAAPGVVNSLESLSGWNGNPVSSAPGALAEVLGLKSDFKAFRAANEGKFKDDDALVEAYTDKVKGRVAPLRWLDTLITGTRSGVDQFQVGLAEQGLVAGSLLGSDAASRGLENTQLTQQNLQAGLGPTGGTFAAGLTKAAGDVGVMLATGGGGTALAEGTGLASAVARKQAINALARSGGKELAEDIVARAPLLVSRNASELASKIGQVTGYSTAMMQSGAGSYAESFNSNLNKFRAAGLNEDAALGEARTAAALDGSAAALITGAMMKVVPGGVESMLGKKLAENPAGVTLRSLVKDVSANGLRTAMKDAAWRQGFKNVAISLGKEAGAEALEEGADEALNGLYASARYNPDMTFSQWIDQVGSASLLGGILGGGVHTVAPGRSAMGSPVTAPATTTTAVDTSVAAPTVAAEPAELPTEEDIADQMAQVELEATAAKLEEQGAHESAAALREIAAAPKVEAPAEEPTTAESGTGLDTIGGAGKAIVDNFYRGIAESLADTGEVPSAERGTRIGQAWEKVKQRGEPTYNDASRFMEVIKEAAANGDTPESWATSFEKAFPAEVETPVAAPAKVPEPGDTVYLSLRFGEPEAVTLVSRSGEGVTVRDSDGTEIEYNRADVTDEAGNPLPLAPTALVPADDTAATAQDTPAPESDQPGMAPAPEPADALRTYLSVYTDDHTEHLLVPEGANVGAVRRDLERHAEKEGLEIRIAENKYRDSEFRKMEENPEEYAYEGKPIATDGTLHELYRDFVTRLSPYLDERWETSMENIRSAGGGVPESAPTEDFIPAPVRNPIEVSKVKVPYFSVNDRVSYLKDGTTGDAQFTNDPMTTMAQVLNGERIPVPRGVEVDPAIIVRKGEVTGVIHPVAEVGIVNKSDTFADVEARYYQNPAVQERSRRAAEGGNSETGERKGTAEARRAQAEVARNDADALAAITGLKLKTEMMQFERDNPNLNESIRDRIFDTAVSMWEAALGRWVSKGKPEGKRPAFSVSLKRARSEQLTRIKKIGLVEGGSAAPVTSIDALPVAQADVDAPIADAAAQDEGSVGLRENETGEASDAIDATTLKGLAAARQLAVELDIVSQEELAENEEDALIPAVRTLSDTIARVNADLNGKYGEGTPEWHLVDKLRNGEAATRKRIAQLMRDFVPTHNAIQSRRLRSRSIIEGDPTEPREDLETGARVLGLQYGDVDAALNRLVQLKHIPQRYVRLARDLKKQLQGRMPSVELVSINADYAGEYDDSSNTIRINLARDNGRGIIDVFLHELVHAAEARAINNPQSPEEEARVAQLRKIRDDLVAKQDVVLKKIDALQADIAKVFGLKKDDPAVRQIVHEVREDFMYALGKEQDEAGNWVDKPSDETNRDLQELVTHLATEPFLRHVASKMPGGFWTKLKAWLAPNKDTAEVLDLAETNPAEKHFNNLTKPGRPASWFDNGFPSEIPPVDGMGSRSVTSFPKLREVIDQLEPQPFNYPYKAGSSEASRLAIAQDYYDDLPEEVQAYGVFKPETVTLKHNRGSGGTEDRLFEHLVTHFDRVTPDNANYVQAIPETLAEPQVMLRDDTTARRLYGKVYAAPNDQKILHLVLVESDPKRAAFVSGEKNYMLNQWAVRVKPEDVAGRGPRQFDFPGNRYGSRAGWQGWMDRQLNMAALRVQKGKEASVQLRSARNNMTEGSDAAPAEVLATIDRGVKALEAGDSFDDVLPKVMAELGYDSFGRPGEKVVYDATAHDDTVGGLLPGDEVEFLSPGYKYPGQEFGAAIKARVTGDPFGSRAVGEDASPLSSVLLGALTGETTAIDTASGHLPGLVFGHRENGYGMTWENVSPAEAKRQSGSNSGSRAATTFRRALGKGVEEDAGWKASGLFGAGVWDKRAQELLVRKNNVEASAEDAANRFLTNVDRFVTKQAKGDRTEEERLYKLVQDALGSTDNRVSEAQYDTAKTNLKGAQAKARGDFMRGVQQATQLAKAGDPTADQVLNDARDQFRDAMNYANFQHELEIRNAHDQNLATIRQTQANALTDINALSPEMHERITAFRQRLDSLSAKIASFTGIDPELAATIDENKGIYLHRGYRLFDDPEYRQDLADNHPRLANVIGRAEVAIREQLIKEDSRQRRKEAREKMIKDHAAQHGISEEKARYDLRNKPNPLDRVTADAQAAAYVNATPQLVKQRFNEVAKLTEAEHPASRPKASSVDDEILKHRKDLPQWLRDLWGQYENPRVNAAHTLLEMEGMVAQNDFLQRMRELGQTPGKEFLAKKDPRTGLIGPIPGVDTSRWVPIVPEDQARNPLAGYYGPEVVRDAFKEITDPKHHGFLYRALMKATGLAMSAKTKWSVQSHMRNFLGNTFFLAANDNIGLSTGGDLKHAFKTVMADVLSTPDKAKEAEIQNLIKLGVVHDNTFVELWKDLTQQTRNWDISKTDAPSIFAQIGDRLKNFSGNVGKAYQAEDDFWKVVSFRSERAKLEAAYPNHTDEQLDEEAARRVRMTMPSYSKAPQIIRLLRKTGVLAPFVTFVGESIRTTANIFRLAIQDIKSGNPALRRNGLARLAAVSTWQGVVPAMITTLLPHALKGAAQAMLGDDDEPADGNPLKDMLKAMTNPASAEQIRALRRFLPSWNQDSQLYVLGTDPQTGNVIYADASYLNPYNYFTDIAIAAFRGFDQPDEELGKRLKDAAANSFRRTLEPFIGEQLIPGAFLDWYARDPESRDPSRKVYEPGDVAALLKAFATGEKQQGMGQAASLAEHLWSDAFQPGTMKTAQRIYKGANSKSDFMGREYNTLFEIASALGLTKFETVNPSQVASRKMKERVRSLNSGASVLTNTITGRGSVSDSDIRDSYIKATDRRQRAMADMRRDYRAALALGASANDVLNSAREEGLGNDVLGQVVNNTYQRFIPGPVTIQRAASSDGAKRDKQDRVRLLQELINNSPATLPLIDNE